MLEMGARKLYIYMTIALCSNYALATAQWCEFVFCEHKCTAHTHTPIVHVCAFKLHWTKNIHSNVGYFCECVSMCKLEHTSFIYEQLNEPIHPEKLSPFLSFLWILLCYGMYCSFQMESSGRKSNIDSRGHFFSYRFFGPKLFIYFMSSL